MSKTIHATCNESVVTADGVEVPEARIISAGLGPSEGVVIIDEDRADYITSNAEDIDDILAWLDTAMDAANSGLAATATALSTIGTAAGVPPLVLGPLVTPVNSAAATFLSVKNGLAEIRARLK